ncbi:MAG: LamG domain-containing protein [Bryobacteraceae bacterium]|nr:LamG domain-containing protein [Bryobacteraceae bacterium]
MFLLALDLLGQAPDTGAGEPGPEQATSCLTVLPNLDGWYDFDGPANPTASVGNLAPDAAWFGSPQLIPGLSGQALRFNGSSFLEVSNTTAFNYATQNFTAALWVRTTGASTTFLDKRCMGSAGGCRTPQGWAVGISPAGRLQLLMGSASPYFYEGFTAFDLKPINDGQWHYVSVSVDRANTRIVFAVDPATDDDFQVISIDGYSGSLTSVRPLRIGGDQTSPTKFTGDLDEAQLYGRALAPFDLLRLYAAGPSGQCRPPICSPVSARRSMVAWYSFDELSGVIWNDRAARNNYLGGGGEQLAGQNGMAVQIVRVPAGGGLRTTDGAAELDAGTNNFSLAAWVRFFPSGNGRRAIIDKQTADNGPGGGYSLMLEDGFLRFQMASAGLPRAASNFWVANRTRLDDGRWHHVAAVVDRTAQAPDLYVDGRVETLGSRRGVVISSSINSGGPLNVGGFAADPSETLGAFDDVSIFTSLLSAADIQSIIESAGTGYCARNDQGCVAPPPGLSSWYRFENATGPFDDSGTAPNEPLVVAGNIIRGSGRVGRGVRLQEGTSSLRTLGATPKLNFDTAPFSLGFWIQPAADPRTGSTGSRTVIEKMTFTSPPNGIRVEQGYRLRLVNGRLELSLASGGNLGIWTANNALRPDQWTMVTVLVPRDTAPRIFLNGIPENLAAAGVNPTGSLANPNPMLVGSSSEPSLNPLSPIAFDFDELSFYNRLLTTAELQGLAAAISGQCFEGVVASVKPVFEVATNPPGIGATVGVSGDSSALDNYATTIAPAAVTVAPLVISAPGGATEYRFRDWSLDGTPNPAWTASVQTVPLPASAASYTANYDTFHRLTVVVTGNCLVTPLPGFYLAGSSQPLAIVLPSGWVVNTATFTPGNNVPRTVSPGVALTMSAPSTLEVVCRDNTLFPITVGTSPSNVGLQVQADGNVVSNSQRFNWPALPARVLAVFPQQQVVGLTQYTFRRWRNASTNTTLANAPLSQVVVLPSAPASFIADFEPTAYQLLVRQTTGCVLNVFPSPGAGGFYAAGTRLSFSVTPASGYTAGFITIQPFSSSNPIIRTAPTDFTLDGPATVSTQCDAQSAAIRFVSSPAPADLSISFLSSVSGLTSRAQGTGSVLMTIAPGTLTFNAAPFTNGGTDGAIRRFVDITPGNLPNGSSVPSPVVNTTYTANYEVQCYYVGVGAQPANGGTFRTTLVFGEKPFLREECYTLGSVVQVEAYPNPGFNFLQWIGDAPSGGRVTQVVVTRAMSLNAIFRAAP